ncbi:MAG TPA: hypothetical protein VM890_06690, partial [Longimicrobium sp.]|nr:hypothetical protein [Longimicrobium sp.]
MKEGTAPGASRSRGGSFIAVDSWPRVAARGLKDACIDARAAWKGQGAVREGGLRAVPAAGFQPVEPTGGTGRRRIRAEGRGEISFATGAPGGR